MLTSVLSQQVIIPYAAFGIFVALGAMVNNDSFQDFAITNNVDVQLSIEHIDRVDREQRLFYCSLDWNPLCVASALCDLICTQHLIRTYAVGFMSAIVCLAAAVLEGLYHLS